MKNKIIMSLLCMLFSLPLYADTFVIVWNESYRSNPNEMLRYVLSAEPLQEGDKVYTIEPTDSKQYKPKIWLSATVLKPTNLQTIDLQTFEGSRSLMLGKAKGWHYIYTAKIHHNMDSRYDIFDALYPGIQSSTKKSSDKLSLSGYLPPNNVKYRYKDRMNCTNNLQSGVVTVEWGKNKISFLNECKSD